MNTLNRTLSIARRTMTLSAVLGVSLVAAQAQQVATPAADTAAQPKLNLQFPAVAAESTFSSSSQDNDVAVADNHFDFVAAAADNAQPPSRRYGRPRYRGGNTNADGSNKWGFLVGAGFQQPVGNTYHYLTPSWGFQVGGGRNFNKNFGVMLQFDYDNFGFTGRTIAQQSFLYDPSNIYGVQGSLDGSTHIWSFSVNPTYTLYSGEGLGAYVVAGAGFYHKRADFTLPQAELYCDPYYGCEQYEANATIDDYTSNAPGFSGGFGLTYKMSHFSNQRLYAEARYVFIDNSYRPGYNINNYATANPNQNNYFPANSNRTTYIPIKFGIRF